MMRPGKLLASASAALALLATPVVAAAAPTGSAKGVSLSKAVGNVPLRASSKVGKSEKLAGGTLLIGLGLASAIVAVVAVAAKGEGKPFQSAG